ncbi:sodium:proton antiporter [Acerihabitans sp. TG2]|uniref:cation:proton antiporter n=1 Tax=Acerihabitans sp. TG2 TaxID=3096008 RepID=UPI002B2247FE|nr:sodium:proton antiporter [Acerihabitans sp. TG2]MEA9390142.1 sodium:proton antiporter [Acerihabitans sp. TG2]
MSFLGWTAVVGGFLLLMSLASGWIHRGPVTSFGLYLAAGIACGPWVLDLLHVDIVAHSELTGKLTEIAMVASLFITGLKLRIPFRHHGWRMGVRLAFPGMLLTVAGITVVAHYLIGLSWPMALAFGAIVAPTDPVLASLISVNDASDKDSLRVSLSSEAGMNDGSALPILMLALLLMNSTEPVTYLHIGHWVLVDVLWALFGGLGIGYVLGRLIGLLATCLRHAQDDIAPSDFIALSLIALSYAAAQSLDASGFLAAFAAGVGLRGAELRIANRHSPENMTDSQRYRPAEELVNPHSRHSFDDHGPKKSMGLVVGDALSFGDTIERLFAAAIIVLLGITLSRHWEPMGLLIAAVLFIVIRPASVYIATIGGRVPRARRLMIGWLGIRGIGSINYIAYAYTHGMAGAQAAYMVNIVFTVIVTSVVVHGLTVTPLFNWRQGKLAIREEQQKQQKQQ